jgi:hypothetical protein
MIFLSPLRWSVAVTIYLILCSLFYCGLIGCLAQEIGSDWGSKARLGFVTFALALAPVQTGIHIANLSIESFLLAGYSVWLAGKCRDVLAGILLALSLCIKPTMAFPLVIVYVLMRRWKAIAVCAGVGGLIAAVAMARLAWIGGWQQDYRANMSYLFGPSGAASFSNSSSGRFDLLNLQLPFYELTHNNLIANLVPWIVVGVLGVVWLRLFAREKFRWDWVFIAAALLLGMMPIYQRNYNGGVVLFALLWAFRNIERRIAKAVLAVMCVFLVPGEAILRSVGAGHLSATFQGDFFWRCFVLPQTTWAILALTIFLLIGASNEMRQSDSDQV